jgi:hypothetical protein
MCRRCLANLGVPAARARAQAFGAGKLTGAPRVAHSLHRHCGIRRWRAFSAARAVPVAHRKGLGQFRL